MRGLRCERLALLAAVAALKAGAPAAVTETFSRTRLNGRAGATYGTSALDPSLQTLLLERALPPA